jgi:hypothetical protein
MKSAIVMFLVIASTAASLAAAQDGNGQGPPKRTAVTLGLLPASQSAGSLLLLQPSAPKVR